MAELPPGWVWLAGDRLLAWRGTAAPVHGFTSRRGGVSHPPFASLNVSTRHGDAPEAVWENIRRIREDLGISSSWTMLHQVHGNEVVCIGSEERHVDTRGDALLTDVPGKTLAVGVADCTPILAWTTQEAAHEPGSRVAAIHAGWRGTAAQVAVRTLDHAKDIWGVSPGAWRVLLGPSARSCCYEVGEEVVEALGDTIADLGGLHAADSTGSPPWLDRSHGRPRVSPAVVARAQLRAAGVPPEHIHDCGICTLCGAETWFSYRRDGVHSGRAVGVIVCPDLLPTKLATR